MSNSYPPPPDGPYSAPPPAGGYYGGNTREHPQGTTILIMGILSLVLCSVAGPIAWVMGNSAVKEMDATPGVIYTNRGQVNAGRICGMIATILLVIGLVVLGILVATGGLAFLSTANR